MPEPEFSVLKSSEGSETFDAGETIFRAGDAGDCMYVVQQGEVELRVGDTVVDTVRSGGIFGEMALIDQQDRSATAVARTAVRLARVDEKRFQFLTQQTPNFALNVLRVIAHRLREMNQAE